ncbi:hypothetical protein FRB99_007799, partial [Tulasnella sp. 403]
MAGSEIPLQPIPSTSTAHLNDPMRRALDFTTTATRTRRPGALGEDGLDDEMDQLDTMEHPLFDALDRNTVAHTQQRIRTPWKRSLFRLFESPTSSPPAFVVHIVSTGLIVVSAFITILETLPIFHSTSPNVWFGLETSIVVLFTVEYCGRMLAHSETWAELLRWGGSFFAIIDLLAILPYYIEIAIGADTTAFFRFSILRTFRLLRVFRPFRYSNTILLTIEVMYLAVKRSKEALFALAFFVGMALVVFSTLLYFAERGTWDQNLGLFVNADGTPSDFESIPAAAWFVLVTITTVGYGEIIPRSFLGRLITIPLLMFGLLLIALPSFVLGREFSSVWEGMGGSKLTMTRFTNWQKATGRDVEERDPRTTSDANDPGRIDSTGSENEQRGLIFSAGSNDEDGTHAHLPQANRPTVPPLQTNFEQHSTSTHEIPLDTPDVPYLPFSPMRRKRREADGISNLKLAENQQVLSGQLEELMLAVQALREE